MMNRFFISLFLFPLIYFAQEETFLSKAINQNRVVLSKILNPLFNQQFLKGGLNKSYPQNHYYLNYVAI